LPRVAADPRRVRQVLLKLTENALKFTEQGGVELRVAGETASDGRKWVRFRVSDSGHGVAPHIARHLFKPFALGDESYARKEQGAGLGLAVARRIVEQAGGSIGFESELNKGATFWFTLPAIGAEASQSRPAPDLAASTPPSHLTLLLFTHRPDVREYLIDLLEPFGNRLTCAADFAEAITRGAREPFDAIVANAADADQIAASPGIRAPVIALALQGEHAPACAADILRGPLTPEALYEALGKIAGARPADGQDTPDDAVASIDPVAFTTLEQSVGLPTLIEILQCYIGTAEELTAALAEACAVENWTEAAKLAQDIVGAAGGLGLSAITQAARSFAQKTRDGGDSHSLRNAAQLVVGEHLRARKALGHLYPGLAA
jgi:HPt (histidine-containing phosphotransfer) domain-containing protein/CheY-like chemotaxis protein